MHAKLLARLGTLVTGGGLLLWSATAMAGWSDFNMPWGATDYAHRVYDLHMMAFWVCVAIGIVVFGVMFYSIFHHRKSRGAVPAKFHESTTVELIWTIIPALILIGMAIPATKTLVAMTDTANTKLTVKVTGYQWKWHYAYPQDKIAFFSMLSTPTDEIYNLKKKDPHYLLEVDHPLVLPIKTKILFQITGADVIHSWWVPALGWKRDAIPGYVNEMWTNIDKPGTYRGQCAELCGRGHAFMPIVVKAVTQDQFKQWVAKMQNGQGNQSNQSKTAASTIPAAGKAKAQGVAGATTKPRPSANLAAASASTITLRSGQTVARSDSASALH